MGYCAPPLRCAPGCSRHTLAVCRRQSPMRCVATSLPALHAAGMAAGDGDWPAVWAVPAASQFAPGVRALGAREIGRRAGRVRLAESLSPTAMLRLRCVARLPGHRGCVNVARFAPSGMLLGTGSDDCTVGLWVRAGATTPRISALDTARDDCICGEWHGDGDALPVDDAGHLGSTSKGLAPLRLASRLRTGHAGNIFGLGFFPGREDALATAAADGEVRFFDLNSSTSASALTGMNGDATGMAQRVCCIGPFVALSAATDGCARIHDVRAPELCGQAAVVCRWPEGRLRALDAHPLEPNVFAAAGDGALARLFDLRSSAAKSKHAAIAAIAARFSLAGAFCELQACSPEQPSPRVSGLRWSPDGHRIVASCIGGGVRVFGAGPVWERLATLPSASASAEARRGARSRAAEASLVRGRAGAVASASHVPRRPEQERFQDGFPRHVEAEREKRGLLSWTMTWASMQAELLSEEAPWNELAVPLHSGGAAPADAVGLSRRLVRALHMWSRGGSAAGSARSSAPTADWRRAVLAEAGGLVSLPSVKPSCEQLEGARNVRTVKEAVFLGPESNVVVAGSDCGSLFAWSIGGSRSGQVQPQLLRAWRADGRIANVAEPVPATRSAPGSCAALSGGWSLISAGIDYDIKAWDLIGPAAGAGREAEACDERPLPRDPEWAVRAATAALRDGDRDRDRGGSADASLAVRQAFADLDSHRFASSAHGPCATFGETWPLFPRDLLPEGCPPGPAGVFCAAAAQGASLAATDSSTTDASMRAETLAAYRAAPIGWAATPSQLRALVEANVCALLQASAARR